MTVGIHGLLLCALLGPLLGLSANAYADTSENVYDTIKREERQIRAPEPVGRGVVGTFDARTGVFTGLRTRTQRVDRGQKPRRVEIVPRLRINGVRATLVFRLRHVVTNGSVTLVVNGRRRPVTAGQTRVLVDVRRARMARWTLTNVSGVEVSDRVAIDRPRILGAGAFTMEAVPLAIVYAPPQPAAIDRRNSAAFGRRTIFGTNIATSFTREQSTTTPAPTGYEESSRLAAAIKAAGNGLSSANDPEAKAAGAVLSAIGSAMGEAESTREGVKTVARRTSVDYSLTESIRCQTATRLEPGGGDIIVFLQNARLVWFDDGVRTRLAVLGAQGFGCQTVGLLRQALATLESAAAPSPLCVAPVARRNAAPIPLRPCREGMSAETIRGLISLDPFAVAGPGVALPPDRYRPATPPELALDPAVNVTFSYSASVSNADVHARTSSTILTRDTSAGFLSVVGIGPSRTERVVSRITASSAATFRTQRTVFGNVRVEGPPPGTTTMSVYYDRIFGTFALQARAP